LRRIGDHGDQRVAALCNSGGIRRFDCAAGYESLDAIATPVCAYAESEPGTHETLAHRRAHRADTDQSDCFHLKFDRLGRRSG
jgi:hypothetical protein